MKISIIAWLAAAPLACLITAADADEPVAVALPTGAIPQARPAAMPSPATPKIKIQPLSVTIQLTDDGTKFTGTLSGIDQWPMKTSFGETNVPLSAVAGIKFAEEGHPSTTIVLHNGDSVTGALDLHHVQIETSWGKAEIESGHIKSMLFAPGLSWTTEPGLSGTRWRLIADKDTRSAPKPPGANPMPNTDATASLATPPAAARPTSPQPGLAQPGFAQPGYTQPGFAQPGFAQPGFAQPGFAQPGSRPAAPGRP